MALASGEDRIQTSDILLDRSDRVRLEILGPDRAKFLHNLVTNEVKRLPVGRGCEAFVTSPQGKTIGYVTLHAGDDRIMVRTDPGGMSLALPHFQKYGVFDDVEILDKSAETFEIHLAGQTARAFIAGVGAKLPEAAELAHIESEIGGVAVRVISESPMGLPGLTLIGNASAAERVRELLQSPSEAGLIRLLEPGEYEFMRIEAGTPVFGADITEKNLPQEIGRDARAISFVKGCYLGQETVARLDALGHVNQVMKGFSLESGTPVPPPRSIIEFGGKKVGVITSSARSPAWGATVALGFVRTAQAADGTMVSVIVAGEEAARAATVCDLPFAKPK